MSATVREVVRRVRPFTMTSPERVACLCRATAYVVDEGVEGAFVECGVWKGGSVMAMALAMEAQGAVRDIHLFDTFAGMVEPDAMDIDHQGSPASDQWHVGWCAAAQAEVAANIRSTGYDMARVHMVPGRVEDTIPAAAPPSIALLRLDTDWFRSTYHELEHLYPRLSPRGVLIIDDYGHWSGARDAVGRYFATLRHPPSLEEIDYTGRVCVKP